MNKSIIIKVLKRQLYQEQVSDLLIISVTTSIKAVLLLWSQEERHQQFYIYKKYLPCTCITFFFLEFDLNLPAG